MAEGDKVLTEQDCDCLDRVLTKCPKVREVIEACKEAGLDFSGPLEEINEMERIAAGLKRKFFPNRT